MFELNCSKNKYENDEDAIELFYSLRYSKLDARELRSDVGRWVDVDLPILDNKEFYDILEEIAGYMGKDPKYNWGPDMTKEQFALFVKDAIDEVAYIIRKFWLRMWSDEHLKVLEKMLEHGEKIKPCEGVEIGQYEVQYELGHREDEPKEEDERWPVFDCLP